VSSVAPLMRQNFIEYASYVIVDRAIPDLHDGCKPVQRRILHTLFTMDDGKFNKVANVIGECMKLHPHGDASIGDALVVLANKEYFIERQGNFGNPITGDPSAAARYIECRLTPLARETLFNKELTDWAPSYDGRRDEPVVLPVKVPVLLMLGTDGIAVGMSTRILPHNFRELLRAQIALLQGKGVELFPDFRQGGIVDVSEYEDGQGRVRVRARIESKGDKHVVIRETPYSTTTEGLIASIESAAQKGQVKISGIHDYTTEEVEVQLELSRGVYADEVIPQLFAYTDCEVSISVNLLAIRGRHPERLTVTDVLAELTNRLRERIKAELQLELDKLLDRQHWLTLEQIFIENRIYKRIEEAESQEKVDREIRTGINKFKKLFVREMTDDDIKRLLDLRIRRISRFDIEKNRKEIDDIVAAIKKVQGKLRNLTKTTIDYVQGLIDTYGEEWPRRSELATFEQVDKREVARASMKVTYNPRTGFFGTASSGDKFPLQVSEFDKILLVSADGSYRIVTAPEKLLITGKLIWAGVFDEEEGQVFTILYRDKKKNAFAKKVHIQRFTRGREYELIKNREGKIDQIHEGEVGGTVHMDFVPAKRQRLKEVDFDLGELDFCGIGARGARMAPKPVAKLKLRR